MGNVTQQQQQQQSTRWDGCFQDNVSARKGLFVPCKLSMAFDERNLHDYLINLLFSQITHHGKIYSIINCFTMLLMQIRSISDLSSSYVLHVVLSAVSHH